mgnify:CR=1 FL=1
MKGTQIILFNDNKSPPSGAWWNATRVNLGHNPDEWSDEVVTKGETGGFNGGGAANRGYHDRFGPLRSARRPSVVLTKANATLHVCTSDFSPLISAGFSAWGGL